MQCPHALLSKFTPTDHPVPDYQRFRSIQRDKSRPQQMRSPLEGRKCRSRRFAIDWLINCWIFVWTRFILTSVVQCEDNGKMDVCEYANRGVRKGQRCDVVVGGPIRS